jgi:hypothetical protein
MIRDIFTVKYKIECTRRGIPDKSLSDALIAKLISDAETDIQRRNRVLESSGTINLITSTYIYDLPANFGEIKTVIYTDTNNGISPLERVDLQTLQEIKADAGIPTQYSLKLVDDLPQIQFNLAKTGNIITVFYYVDLDSGYTTITGLPKLPHVYTNAIVLQMLSQFFDDIQIKYERELMSLKESQYTNRRFLKYKINGGIG